MKYYTFLQEGWFSKSDEEVCKENISKRTAREYCEDMKLFLKCYSELLFVICLLDDPIRSEIFLQNLRRNHSKVQHLEDLRYDDLDQGGKTIFCVVNGIYRSMDEGLLDRILDSLLKHFDRFEPDEFKRLYINSCLDTAYSNLYNYMKQNKLNDLIKEIETEVNKTPLIRSIKECLEDGMLAAKEDGYDIRKTIIPKSIIKSTHQKFNVKSHPKLPKLLVNTTPKNKIMKLKK